MNRHVLCALLIFILYLYSPKKSKVVDGTSPSKVKLDALKIGTPSKSGKAKYVYMYILFDILLILMLSFI